MTRWIAATQAGRAAMERREKPRTQALTRLSLLGALVLLMSALAGCSTSTGSSSSGINYTLGLQGSTADHPAQPPAISQGPDGEYAFVYDNQVWVHVKGQSQAVQVTRLILSNGATLVWGPLVWSPSGASLAFALTQNPNPMQPTQPAGSIYYADLSKCLSESGSACPVYQTGATGSVYGHGYSWLDDQWIIYGGGGGLLAYDVADQNGWRVWQLRAGVDEQQDYGCGQTRAYGDVQVAGTQLYYTCDNLNAMGKGSAVGKATLYSLSLSAIEFALTGDPNNRDEQVATILNGNGLGSSQVAPLGSVYLDANSNPVSGVWAVHGSNLYMEQVNSVDAKAQTVGVTVCATNIYNFGCGGQTLGGVSTLPMSVRPQISLGPSNTYAFQADKLYVSGSSAPVAITSPYPAQWVGGSVLVATQVVSTQAEASGVVRVKSNVVSIQGASPTVVIAGASDIAAH